MKKLIIAAGVLALATSPLFAQGTNQRTNQGTTGQAIGSEQPSVNKPAQRGQANVNDVYCNGKYIGSDPDPKVRLEMLRSYSPGAGGCDAN
jgi:hypothetical protein